LRPVLLLAEGGTSKSLLLLRRAGLLASRVPSLQSLPSPTTPLPPMIALSPNPSASWASRLHGFGLHLSIAGSPVSTAESSSLSLRTTPSLSVAPHPASRRRSYSQLQAGVGLPGEDLHLLDRMRLRTHDGRDKPGDDASGWGRLNEIRSNRIMRAPDGAKRMGAFGSGEAHPRPSPTGRIASNCRDPPHIPATIAANLSQD